MSKYYVYCNFRRTVIGGPFETPKLAKQFGSYYRKFHSECQLIILGELEG